MTRFQERQNTKLVQLLFHEYKQKARNEFSVLFIIEQKRKTSRGLSGLFNQLLHFCGFSLVVEIV
jgi:hypothetical protein